MEEGISKTCLLSIKMIKNKNTVEVTSKTTFIELKDKEKFWKLQGRLAVNSEIRIIHKKHKL